MQRRRILGTGHDYDGVTHGALALEHGHGLGDGGELLADGHIDADDALALLIDDGVDGHGGLAGLPVTDDELALPAADGDQRVDGLDARLQRGIDRLACDDAGRDALDRAGGRGVDRALVVDGVAEHVDHAADELWAHRHLDHGARGLDRVALLDLGVVTQDHGTDCLLFEVEGHALDAAGELQELTGECAFEAIDASDAVTDLHDGADRTRLHARIRTRRWRT